MDIKIQSIHFDATEKLQAFKRNKNHGYCSRYHTFR